MILTKVRKANHQLSVVKRAEGTRARRHVRIKRAKCSNLDACMVVIHYTQGWMKRGASAAFLTRITKHTPANRGERDQSSLVWSLTLGCGCFFDETGGADADPRGVRLCACVCRMLYQRGGNELLIGDVNISAATKFLLKPAKEVNKLGTSQGADGDDYDQLRAIVGCRFDDENPVLRTSSTSSTRSMRANSVAPLATSSRCKLEASQT